jgi:Protein of unknown function (DUF3024)
VNTLRAACSIWRVFWQRRDPKWHGYEFRPEVTTIDAVASSVSEDAHASCSASIGSVASERGEEM